MKKFVGILLLMSATTSIASDDALLDQDFRRLASDEVVNLADEYAGKVLLVVNTASKCGNTPQYDGLEKLYSEYGDKGLVVLGFPSNDLTTSVSACISARSVRRNLSRAGVA